MQKPTRIAGAAIVAAACAGLWGSGYVPEGSLLLQIEGEAPRTLKAGDSFFVPAGKPHDGKNVGSGAAKVLATYIVETGKPVASPVK